MLLVNEDPSVRSIKTYSQLKCDFTVLQKVGVYPGGLKTNEKVGHFKKLKLSFSILQSS